MRTVFLAGVAMAVACPALAQDSGGQRGETPPALQDFRLDPARDPNRPTTPQRAGPEIDNRPPVALPSASGATPPPAIVPTVNPTTVRQSAPRIARPQDRAPATPAVAAQPPLAPPVTEVPPAPAPEVPLPSTLPSQNAAPDAAPEVTPQSGAAYWWPWIIGGLLLAGGLVFLLIRRRRSGHSDWQEETPSAAPAPAPPVAQPSPPARPRPAAPPLPIPAPQAPVIAAHPVSLHFTPLAARTTVAGAQLTYRLALRNDSRDAIDGLAVAAFIANADANQPQALAAFYDDAFAPEVHRIDSIAPGASVTVDGELHLTGARLTPIEVQGRALLIPVVAFKAISLDGDDMARGAFIVGQESTPPGARMGPFRLDQGPRQFRSLGSRPAQGLVAA